MTTASKQTNKQPKVFFLLKIPKFCINLFLESATFKIGRQSCEKNKEAMLAILELACPKKFIVFIK